VKEVAEAIAPVVVKAPLFVTVITPPVFAVKEVALIILPFNTMPAAVVVVTAPFKAVVPVIAVVEPIFKEAAAIVDEAVTFAAEAIIKLFKAKVAPTELVMLTDPVPAINVKFLAEVTLFTRPPKIMSPPEVLIEILPYKFIVPVFAALGYSQTGPPAVVILLYKSIKGLFGL
jgi:hypothetical protein